MSGKCPRCGGNVSTEKSSMSGEVWREYYCHACGWKKEVNEGTAVWKIISDANQELEAERAARENGSTKKKTRSE